MPGHGWCEPKGRHSYHPVACRKDAPNQQWSFASNGTIRGLTGKCLDVAGGNPNDGTPVILWSCHGGPNQQWHFGEDQTIRGLAGKCLDVTGGSSNDGTPCHPAVPVTANLTSSGKKVHSSTPFCPTLPRAADFNDYFFSRLCAKCSLSMVTIMLFDWFQSWIPSSTPAFRESIALGAEFWRRERPSANIASLAPILARRSRIIVGGSRL